MNFGGADVRPELAHDRHSSFRWRAMLAGAVVLGIILAVHFAHPDELLGDLTYTAATGGGAVFGWIGLRRSATELRTAWRLILLGLSASAIGDVIYTYVHWSSGEIPDVSAGDVFWVVGYIAVGAGVIRLLGAGRRDRRIEIDALIDVASVAIIALVVMRSPMASVITDASVSPFVRVVWTSYPVLDVALMALLVPAMLSRRLRSWAGAFLIVGLGLWLFADFTTTLVPEATVVVRLMDAGWMVGAWCMGSAVWLAGSRQARTSVRLEHVGPLRLAVGLAPLLVPGLIDLIAHLQGKSPDATPLFLATAALTALAYGRAVRLTRASERSLRRLQSRERYYSKLAANSSDAVVVVGADRKVINTDQNLARLLGYENLSGENPPVMQFLEPEDVEVAIAAFGQTMSEPGVVQEFELRFVKSDGTRRWFALRAVNLCDDPDVGGVVGNLSDITDRKRFEDELTHHSLHDPLTGLANRMLFHDRVDHALQRSTRTGLDVAVILLDFDGFKAINESLGHEVGDAVLRELADRLVRTFRAADTVARLAGDEFAMLVEHSHDALDDATTMAQRILQALADPVTVSEHRLVLSASLGIAVGTPISSASSMLRDADVAMYQAKSNGRGRWIVYEPGMRSGSAERLRLESDLVAALDCRQFRLVYQPILELETERVVGFEALLRWDHPTLGVVTPDRFIPIIEENGMIVPIGEWVLRHACQTAARWNSTYPMRRPLTMAVNLSARQITSGALVGGVRDALAQSGFQASRLVLELTETALVQDAVVAADRLHDLRRLGVRLAIDDFGVGYSSLSYLRQFPIDILKIDRSFVNSINERDSIPAIVRGLIELGRTLGLEIIAEGIEEATQRDQLRRAGCDLAQGFYFARPMHEDDAERLVANVASSGSDEDARVSLRRRDGSSPMPLGRP